MFIFVLSKQSIINVQEHGKVCVLDIDVEGVKQLKNSDLKPLFVFIMPPSVDELKKRLTERNTETEESLKKRLNAAKVEIEYGKTLNKSIRFFGYEVMRVYFFFCRQYTRQFRSSYRKS